MPMSIGLVLATDFQMIKAAAVIGAETARKKHRRHTELNYSRRNHAVQRTTGFYSFLSGLKKGSPYLVTERRVPELIPVLSSQPAGDVSHKLGGRLPLLSGRSAVTTATLKRAATNFATW